MINRLRKDIEIIIHSVPFLGVRLILIDADIIFKRSTIFSNLVIYANAEG